MKVRDNSNLTNSNNNNVETTQFYDEENSSQQFNSNNNSNRQPQQSAPPQKRPLTLDLGGKPPNKRQRFNSAVNTVSVLNSPDLQMLKMASPELEKFIMANNTIETPTPSLVYPTKVTSEQEAYAKGFVEALKSLHNENSHQTSTTTTTAPITTSVQQSVASTTISVAVAPQVQQQQQPHQQQSSVANAPQSSSIINAVGMSGGSITYTNLDETYPVQIKDEPQTVPNSPLSPIDMESQEKIKLERKRQRNRVAASKCRKRKLERISKLEEKVKNLKGENGELGSVVKQLKAHVFQLKQQVIEHIQTGCNIPVYNNTYFKGSNEIEIK